MTAEKFDKMKAEFDEADRLLDKYQGLLFRAAKGLEVERHSFHIYNLSGPEFCGPSGSTTDNGMNGREFPDAEKIAKAVCKRAKARSEMIAMWPSLDQNEQEARPFPS